ncbi:MAG: glycoside hydrolase family 88 protein [Prevotella sp.]|nr:glycoside hydrolase family 88 protein [Prevotella sp.]
MKRTLLIAVATLAATAVANAWTFQKGVRYSELVINSRINDFKANKTPAGFGVFNDKGEMVHQPNNAQKTLDYVPGLVAMAIMEAVDYYKDNPNVNVKPWFYAIQNYGCSFDIASGGKQGKSFDDLNAVKLYFKLRDMAANSKFGDTDRFTNRQTVDIAEQRMETALQGIKNANEKYSIKEGTLKGAAGGWWHKSSYTNQMWCDGQYMGPALLAQLIGNFSGYKSISGDDWSLLTKQFTISWHYLWNADTRLLYHAFTADPSGTAAKDWKGVSAEPGAEVYHSAEYWGRAMGWYFMALVDVLEQMQKSGMKTTEHYQTLQGYLNLLAAGIAGCQDAETGCWRQLLNHDGDFTAQSYNTSYCYTTSPVRNYIESSATALFTAGFLKGMRLNLFDSDYTEVGKRAYRGFIENFMVSDGNGGVHLIGCCKSAGLGGSNYRDGSAEYYLMGKDTEPTVGDPSSASFYTEGKVFGAFILAAIEYERTPGTTTSVTLPHCQPAMTDPAYNLAGQQVRATDDGVRIRRHLKTISH